MAAHTHPSGRRSTIYSVAQACGVSSSTVSRAFTRPDLVRDDVRERILSTAAAMGYRPNRSARATATGRTAMLGLVVPDITNPFMPPLVRAVQRAAADIGCSVTLMDAEESAGAETQLIGQLHGQVDGLILASPRASSRALAEAIDELPCVLVNRVVKELPSVVCDNSGALAHLGDRLAGHGHRTFALLSGPSASWAAKQRARAIRAWANRKEDAGVSLVELGPFDASYDGGRRAGAALLDTAATAAFAFDDVMACGVLAELDARDVQVPMQRSVVGCDDVLLARMVTPSLTTVAAPMAALGDTAITLLHHRIANPGIAAETVTLSGTPVVRDSTAPPAPPAP
ncbi:LacI family DNA-binding transcriptional regulator [Phytoactinopolyspora halotolerans]|uniref:LacI family transcriptional regulator n=1 Tax=Phytoactinopolyspora halotolerans TaxID=1981512 RepID=A0A6L9S9G5_9ACTN|nr:LacI family DNA-binding transcriptional regulator [Phytoactinopolyspora halotolerans]NEE01727.1 LacI family transcriptional regulator [Phytoactinopolyspora halotolerans]